MDGRAVEEVEDPVILMMTNLNGLLLEEKVVVHVVVLMVIQLLFLD